LTNDSDIEMDGALEDALLRTRRFFTKGKVSTDLRTLSKVGGRSAAGVARDERGLMLGDARRRMDLHDVVLCCWPRGCASARRWPWVWADANLDNEIPRVRVAATTVEPRRAATSGQLFRGRFNANRTS
jgi:hypothetical protein